MAQVNYWVCEGIIMRDCEVKPTNNGGTFCMFYIMNNPYSKTIESPDEVVDIAKSIAIPCRCFDRDLNKVLEKWGKKGTKIIITGKAKINPSYVDEKGDTKPASLYMFVESLHMLEKGKQ